MTRQFSFNESYDHSFEIHFADAGIAARHLYGTVFDVGVFRMQGDDAEFVGDRRQLNLQLPSCQEDIAILAMEKCPGIGLDEGKKLVGLLDRNLMAAKERLPGQYAASIGYD